VPTRKKLVRIAKWFHYIFFIITDFRLEKIDLTKKRLSHTCALRFNRISRKPEPTMNNPSATLAAAAATSATPALQLSLPSSPLQRRRHRRRCHLRLEPPGVCFILTPAGFIVTRYVHVCQHTWYMVLSKRRILGLGLKDSILLAIFAGERKSRIPDPQTRVFTKYLKKPHFKP
jgi:hypothetical protein